MGAMNRAPPASESVAEEVAEEAREGELIAGQAYCRYLLCERTDSRLSSKLPGWRELSGVLAPALSGGQRSVCALAGTARAHTVNGGRGQAGRRRRRRPHAGAEGQTTRVSRQLC